MLAGLFTSRKGPPRANAEAQKHFILTLGNHLKQVKKNDLPASGSLAGSKAI